jgi:hypothetical protein
MTLAPAPIELDGLAFLRALQAGEIAPPPIALLLGIELVEVAEGRAVFAAEHRDRARRLHGRGRPPRTHDGDRAGQPRGRGNRQAPRARDREPAHSATGRSNRVDSTTWVCVRMIPGVSRMRSSASSRCAVSAARTWRIALASPATV